MRRIGLSADLPAWFDPATYEGVADFGLMEWASNLAARASWWHSWEFLASLPSPFVEIGEEDIPAVREKFRERFVLDMKRPLLPAMSRDGRGPWPVGKSVEELNIHHYLDMVRLRDATGWGDRNRFRAFQEVLRRSETSRHDDAAHAQVRGEEHSHSLPDTLFRRIADGTPDGSYYRETGVVPIMADLHAPEETAVEEFLRLRRSINEELGLYPLRKRFDAADFQRWTRMQVLPYMDLSLWASIEGAKVSDYLMGVTLYPDELESTNPADRVRRSIRPLVNQLLTVQFSRALVAQAHETDGCREPTSR
ncbi:DUF6387 family protein [Paraburkholderia kururiensis]|uniref:DUF6387 family protein n=1 Tax=Paraburkholderia kururiensis TaxID=984307 RepID=UPI0018F6CE23|nr:DUF6387 family protein [Paraburkholderia kururiensis]